MTSDGRSAAGKWKTVGIDPAPSKATVAWSDDGPTMIPATEVPEYVTWLVKEHDRLLIAWDAPLSFDPNISYSDRPVDKALRKFLKNRKTIGQGAASVLPFAGCPHWAISCAALGNPYGESPGSLALTPDNPCRQEASRGSYLIEVHPAVTMAIWWLESGNRAEMRRYKGARFKEVIARYRAVLTAQQIPEQVDDDDKLDAWVAYRMACDFLDGEALWVGDAATGGYVLPRAASANTRWKLAELIAGAAEELRGKSVPGSAVPPTSQ